MIDAIKNAVTRRLKDKFPNCRVYTEEVKQGLKKPCFFVEVFPATFEVLNDHMEKQNIGVNIGYLPEKYSQDEMIQVANTIKAAFLYHPLVVQKRHLSTYEITNDLDGDYLIIQFAYEFTAPPDVETEEFEEMEQLNIGGI